MTITEIAERHTPPVHVQDHMRELARRDRSRFQMFTRPCVVEVDPSVFLDGWRSGIRLSPWQRNMLALVYRWRVDAGGWPTTDAAAPEED